MLVKKLSKRQKAFQFDSSKVYGIDEAMKIVKQCATSKFDETVDVACMLGIDPRKSDQNVRGAIVLPHGTGKTARVLVFAQGDKAAAAEAAGADKVGFEDLVADIKAGNLDYDVVIATPDAMRVVGQLGQILGPRGLMPNPKVGTVTQDVEQAVKNAKAGQARYRADKNGIVHSGIGKASFDIKALSDNLMSLMQELKRVKPSTAKGIYIKKLMISSTMGPAVSIDLSLFK